MGDIYQDLTDAERVEHIRELAQQLVDTAVRMGVSLRIDRVPLRPLASGHMRHVVEAWPARKLQPETIWPFHTRGLGPSATPQRREISDREWAAQPANMREGCTVRVPGVGEL